jgi:hypothetical protein
MTICWHVDNLFLGHADPSIVTDLLNWLAQLYDTTDKKLYVTRRPKHDYPGMNVNFAMPGVVTFDMVPYLNKIFGDFLEKITGVASSPVADHLFEVWPAHKASILPKEQACAYHHTAAQLLFLSRVRWDIQTIVAFLTTCVKLPDEDN